MTALLIAAAFAAVTDSTPVTGCPAIDVRCAMFVARTPILVPRVANDEQRPSTTRRLLRLGKWTTLATAVGMGAYALSYSRAAERQYARLRDLCEARPASCQLEGPRYTDAAAEALYQSAITRDRRARVGIVGGQLSLLASVGLFIADLRHGEGPRDIPYPSARAERRIGFGVWIGR